MGNKKHKHEEKPEIKSNDGLLYLIISIMFTMCIMLLWDMGDLNPVLTKYNLVEYLR